jgi:hypothetical protein
MKATRVLTAQHRDIAALFDGLSGEAPGDERTRVLSTLAEELIAHMAGEESVFYPAVRRRLADRGLVRRLRDEHLTLRLELRRMLQTSASDAAFLERVTAFRALFDRHACEEERGLFAAVDAALSDAELEVLGGQVLASRPPVWMVTTEQQAPALARATRRLRSRVSLPIPPSRSSAPSTRQS